jgi:hypothetical protein
MMRRTRLATADTLAKIQQERNLHDVNFNRPDSDD